MSDFAAAGVTTLGISPYAPTLEGQLALVRAAAEAHRQAGLGD
jgi:hypothetical protein